jgi:hypothetical protein
MRQASMTTWASRKVPNFSILSSSSLSTLAETDQCGSARAARMAGAGGERVSGLVFRAFVPISLHQEQPGRARSNVDAGMVVPLPIGEADALRRLEQDRIRQCREEEEDRLPAGSIFRSVFIQRAFLRLSPDSAP